MRRTVLLTFFLVVSMVVVGSIEGIAAGREGPRYSCDLIYTPLSEITTFRFGGQTPIDMAGLYYALVTYHTKPVSVEVSDKEVLTGWHTTCIGASFAQKGPAPEKPKLAPPTPLPPPPSPEPVKPAPPPEPVKPVPPPPPPEPVKPVPPPPPVKVEKPKPILDPVQFDISKTNISPLGAKALDRDGSIIKEYPNMKVEIQGHTDNTGSETANKVISEKRANSCQKYLMDKFNISGERIGVKGYGSSKPIADNSTPEGRAKNRRVEFFITNY
jgi:outer membrane protein OmpA-like peptidoglycan-associated protein